jgi:hypothetical protein
MPYALGRWLFVSVSVLEPIIWLESELRAKESVCVTLFLKSLYH